MVAYLAPERGVAFYAIELRGEKKMGRLRFCCEGVEIITEAEPKQSITITTTIPEKTEPFRKANDATVIPAKRKCVKNTVCSCFIHCIYGKCLNTNTTISPPTSTASNFNRRSRNSVCSPVPHPIYAADMKMGNRDRYIPA